MFSPVFLTARWCGSAAWHEAEIYTLTSWCLGPLSAQTSALLLLNCCQGSELPQGLGSQGFFWCVCHTQLFWAPWVSSAQTCSHCPILLRFEASSRSSQNHLQHCSKHLCWAYMVLILWSYMLEFDEFRCSSSSQCPLFSAAGGGSVVTEPQISWGLDFVWDVMLGVKGTRPSLF